MSFSRRKHRRRRSVLPAILVTLALPLAALCDEDHSTALAAEQEPVQEAPVVLSGNIVWPPFLGQHTIGWTFSIYYYAFPRDWVARSLRLMPIRIDEATHLFLNPTSTEIQDPLNLSSIPETLKPPAPSVALVTLCDPITIPSDCHEEFMLFSSRDTSYQASCVDVWGQWYPCPGTSRFAINAPCSNATLRTNFIFSTSSEPQNSCEGQSACQERDPR
ncbi:MAG: hypothetical protein ACAI35_07330 [Candidatus Methylacidiphilales bacterium]|nr:hypothetical protein [Candidatus Methylacidiphilales bacterium]